MVAMDDIQMLYLELPYYPGVGDWSCFFFMRLPSLLVVMIIFGKSRDLKTKNS